MGGTPSVMRAGDGATTATLQNAPAGMSTPVVAPDGTLRVLSGAGTGGPVMLHAYAPDGHAGCGPPAWSRAPHHAWAAPRRPA
ncbi:MAG: hypothetical protein U0Y82_16285 [Thermoleophilia bacterium]